MGKNGILPFLPTISKNIVLNNIKEIYDIHTSYPFKEGPTKTTGRIEGTTSYGGICSV